MRALVAFALLLVACGGSTPTPNADLMADTTVGKNRCQPGKTTDRPFIVEWDATDIASFESKAARDIVMVKIDGCDLKILDCRDDGIPGKYGAYDAPQWTSGVTEGFEIKNEGDLYAKVPFGASLLAANVKGGNELQMTYFVSGSRPALRSMIYRNDVAKNPLCASATHFVAGYDMGAFDLTQKGDSSANADLKAGGAGAGGDMMHHQGHVRTAGSLADCKKESARELAHCRVPIRLTLREIADGDNPSPPPAASAPTPSMQDWSALMASASRKMNLSDGPGCLADLDRAASMQPEANNNSDMTRAFCEMLAGRCDDGRRRYRAALQRTAPQLTPQQADNSVLQKATQYCQGTEATPLERATRDHRDVIDAQDQQDGARCTSIGNDLVDAWPKIGPDVDRRAKGQAEMALKYGADCIAKYGGDCAVGVKLLQLHVSETYTNASEATRKAVFASYQCPAGSGQTPAGASPTAPTPPKKRKKRAAPAPSN